MAKKCKELQTRLRLQRPQFHLKTVVETTTTIAGSWHLSGFYRTVFIGYRINTQPSSSKIAPLCFQKIQNEELLSVFKLTSPLSVKPKVVAKETKWVKGIEGGKRQVWTAPTPHEALIPRFWAHPLFFPPQTWELGTSKAVTRHNTINDADICYSFLFLWV